MWKKDDVMPPTSSNPQPEAPTPRPEPRRPASTGSERATIGRSITIRGEVSGDEDLLIQGRIDGSVDLQEQSVTVGREGRVKANITARVVTVEGEVEGDLRAQEQVILRSAARVEGDISAPRVVLEDGATFRGLVDMGDPSRGEKKAGEAAPTSKGSAKSGTDAKPGDEPSDSSPDKAKEAKEGKAAADGPSKASSSGTGTGKGASGTAEKTLL